MDYKPKYRKELYKEAGFVMNRCEDCKHYVGSKSDCKVKNKVIRKHSTGEYREWVNEPEVTNECDFFDPVEK